MSSRRVLGFSAEHALLFVRNGASVCPPPTSMLRPLKAATFATVRPCRVPLNIKTGHNTQVIPSPRHLQTSSSHSGPVKVSPHPTSTSTVSTKGPLSPSALEADADLEVETPVSVPLSHQFRNMMRLLTHSVVVCTSTHQATPRAMTMSSFTSLALNPTPAVSFNIATPSRTLDAIRSSGLFNIHVLAADVSGAKVANWCRQGNEGALQLFARLREDCQCQVAVPRGGEPNGPVLLQGPGVLHVLRCRLLDEPAGGLVKVRDHVIVLGEVMEIVDSEGQGEGGRRRDFGLAYADAKYRQPGRSISPEDEIELEMEVEIGK